MSGQVRPHLTAEVAAAADLAALEAVRVAALGKQGQVSLQLKSLGPMSPDERRVQGPLINGLRDRIAAAIAEKKAALEAAELEARRPTSAITARVIAPTEGGVVVCTMWESAAARDAYQSEPEHQEALQASGLMAAVTDMRSRVFENAELSLR